jgi:predicted RNA-binding Zn ribbon-like protein
MPDDLAIPDRELAFRWRGGHPVLDFTATVGERWRRGIERLRRPEDLARWMREAGLVDGDLSVTQEQLEAARELREALYGVATAVRTGTRPRRKDLQLVNRWATEPLPSRTLSVGSQGVGVRRGRDSVDDWLAWLAREGVELLGGPSARRVKECAGDECALLFLDESRGASRRWCSMDDCGVRSKMAAYRARRERSAS